MDLEIEFRAFKTFSLLEVNIFLKERVVLP